MRVYAAAQEATQVRRLERRWLLGRVLRKLETEPDRRDDSSWTEKRITLLRSIEYAGDDMARTRVSPKFQVVIPKEIRERHGLKAGQEMQVISKGNVIALVPDRPLSAFRGILRGMPTSGYREKKDRRL